MRTRGERRRRTQIIWDRRAKLFYRTWYTGVPCEENELPDHKIKGKINKKYWRPAESWKEFQEKNPSMHLYKNTGTIWNHGYWTKYERHRLNKQSRRNAKLDILDGIEVAYERTNLK